MVKKVKYVFIIAILIISASNDLFGESLPEKMVWIVSLAMS